MKATLKKVGAAALGVALSPQARRYEIPLAILVYEGVRKALGHP